MASIRSFLVRDSAGAPVTGAAGSFTSIARTRAGVVRTVPPITERALGLYALAPTDNDEAEGLIVLIDTGAGMIQRRKCFAIYRADSANQFFAFHLESPDASLWPGPGLPSIPAGGYRDSNGARTAPELVAAIEPYLWSATPSHADVAARCSIRIDGPAGSNVPYFTGWTDAVGNPVGAPDPYNPPRTGGLLRSSPGQVR